MTTNFTNSATAPTDSGRQRQSLLAGVLNRLFEPVDAASLTLFRIGFGAIAVWWAIDYLFRGRMHAVYVAPQFHFTYYGFDWVQPWPGGGMYLHFIALTLFAFCIAAGLLYRWFACLFALGVTYVFLLDRTNYQNHYYLLVLVSWMMVLLPLNRMWSLDAINGRVRSSQSVPRWALWLAQFHVGVPYLFGGLAKFEVDWFAGAPLRQTLQAHDWWPIVGPWFHYEAVVQLFIWGGLLFDLLVVPMLLWRPTRIPAYLLCVFFHLMNSQLFSIHIFPWLMILATTLFFEPDWPRKIFRLPPARIPAAVPVSWASLSQGSRACVLLACLYCTFHCTWPFRHYLYPGRASWTEQGHFFAWRMMLRGKTVALRFYVTDPQTGQTQIPDLRPILSPVQVGVFARDPEMILHLAHYIADLYRNEAELEVEVRALVLTSLNGRKPQLQIDPNVDLAKQPRGFHQRPWIMPEKEPLPAHPWSLPIDQWEQVLDLPPLEFLPQSTSLSANKSRT